MDQLIVDRLNGANIPMTFHDMQLKDVTGGESVKYWIDNSYRDDKANGIGMHMHGDPRTRAKLFPMLARSLVIVGDNVFFTQMVVIRDIARSEDHPLSEKAFTCEALFVQFFCSPDEHVPYTHAERAEIEQLLLTRATHGRRNYFSAMGHLGQCTWWASDFLAEIEQYTRDFPI